MPHQCEPVRGGSVVTRAASEVHQLSATVQNPAEVVWTCAMQDSSSDTVLSLQGGHDCSAATNLNHFSSPAPSWKRRPQNFRL